MTVKQEAAAKKKTENAKKKAEKIEADKKAEQKLKIKMKKDAHHSMIICFEASQKLKGVERTNMLLAGVLRGMLYLVEAEGWSTEVGR